MFEEDKGEAWVAKHRLVRNITRECFFGRTKDCSICRMYSVSFHIPQYFEIETN